MYVSHTSIHKYSVMQRYVLLRRCTAWRVCGSARSTVSHLPPSKLRIGSSIGCGSPACIALTSCCRCYGSPTHVYSRHTHAHRSSGCIKNDNYANSNRCRNECSTTTKETIPGTTCANTARVQPKTTVSLGPRSPQAFAERLRFGNFVSLLDLAHAPYAPEPLNVLRELLARAYHPPCTGADTVHTVDSHRSSTAWSALSGDETQRRHRCVTQALSRVQDVRRLLAEAVAQAQHCVDVVRELGDEESEGVLRQAVSQLHDFTDFYFDDGVTSRNTSSSAAALPSSAPVVLLTESSLVEYDHDATIAVAAANTAGANASTETATHISSSDDTESRTSDSPDIIGKTDDRDSDDTSHVGGGSSNARDEERMHTEPVSSPSFLTTTTTTTAAAEWQLPDEVQVEVLHGLLHMASVLGSQTSAIYVLDAMLQRNELAMRQSSRDCTNRITALELSGTKDKSPLDSAYVSSTVSSSAADASIWCNVPNAQHHIAAMQSCAATGDFDTAALLHRRLLRHAESGRVTTLSVTHLTEAIMALARCCRRATDYRALRHYLVDSDATHVIPISVALYTSLLEAVSRVEGMPAMRRMSHALALFRALDDNGLVPQLETYSALVACAAMCGATTEAFAWYHAARKAQLNSHATMDRSTRCQRIVRGTNGNECSDMVCDNMTHFPPALYAHLLSAYVRGGYAADARATLRVLVEAGAPLTRMAWQAILRGDPAQWSVREVEEVLEMMQKGYRLQPTPESYGFLIRVCASAQHAAGVTTLLRLVDVHERVVSTLSVPHSGPSPSQNNSSLQESPCGDLVDDVLLTRHPDYVAAVEEALVHLRVFVRAAEGCSDCDRSAYTTPLLRRLTLPLIRLAQRRMNAYVTLPPQLPTRLPDGRGSCVAVLAADVLGCIGMLVQPLLSYYSAIVIPYSALWAWRQECLGKISPSRDRPPNRSHRQAKDAMQSGETEMIKSGRLHVHRHDAAAGAQQQQQEEDEEAEELRALEECRRQESELRHFLHTYRDVIHLVSLEEEMRWGRDWRRYGVTMHDLHARSAALAIHLARKDVYYDSEVEEDNGVDSDGMHDDDGSARDSHEGNVCAKSDDTRDDRGEACSLRAMSNSQNRNGPHEVHAVSVSHDEEEKARATSSGLTQRCSLYASLEATVVVVSTSYSRCGRVVQQLKAHYSTGRRRNNHTTLGHGATARRNSNWTCRSSSDVRASLLSDLEGDVDAYRSRVNHQHDDYANSHSNGGGVDRNVRTKNSSTNHIGSRSHAANQDGNASPELCEALSRVYYHNPLTQPHWTPPSHSAAAAVAMKTTGSLATAAATRTKLRRDDGVRALPAEAALRLYRTALAEDAV